MTRGQSKVFLHAVETLQYENSPETLARSGVYYGFGTKSLRSLRIFAGAACGLWALSFPALGQEEPGDQIISFGIDQKFGATDNIRLDPTSLGTTYSSDTALSFGFDSTTGTQELHFAIGGVGRVVDDPVVGHDSGFRDPFVALNYSRESVGSRLSLNFEYERPDLAFLDRLTSSGVPTEDDFYTGGGTREEYLAGFRLETGLNTPLGFVFDLNSEARSYSDVTDPVLFANQTNSASVAGIFRFSPVLNGRLELAQDQYRAEDTAETRRKTTEFTFSLDYELSEISALSVSLGHSKVVESFNTLPGVENVTTGPIGQVSFNRLMPNGSVGAMLETTNSEQGRQNTLEFSRFFELPAGALGISLGATNGDSFQPRPVGEITFVKEMPTSEINLGISREVSISSLLSQATETTQADISYDYTVNDLSSVSLTLYYADIALIGNNSAGGDRERGGISAAYTHEITKDWDLRLGYEYIYYSSSTDGTAQSNSLSFSLQRDFSMFR